MFCDLAEAVVEEVAGRSRLEGQALIRLIDAASINLRAKRVGRAEADARWLGLKRHLLGRAARRRFGVPEAP